MGLPVRLSGATSNSTSSDNTNAGENEMNNSMQSRAEAWVKNIG